MIKKILILIIVFILVCLVVNAEEEVKNVEFNEEGKFIVAESGAYNYGETNFVLEEGMEVILKEEGVYEIDGVELKGKSIEANFDENGGYVFSIGAKGYINGVSISNAGDIKVNQEGIIIGIAKVSCLVEGVSIKEESFFKYGTLDGVPSISFENSEILGFGEFKGIIDGNKITFPGGFCPTCTIKVSEGNIDSLVWGNFEFKEFNVHVDKEVMLNQEEGNYIIQKGELLIAGGEGFTIKKGDSEVELKGGKVRINPLFSEGSLLRRGDDSEEVRQLQRLLNNLQYTSDDNALLEEDGKFGKKTREALRKYQEDLGVKADGILGKETARAITEKNGYVVSVEGDVSLPGFDIKGGEIIENNKEPILQIIDTGDVNGIVLPSYSKWQAREDFFKSFEVEDNNGDGLVNNQDVINHFVEEGGSYEEGAKKAKEFGIDLDYAASNREDVDLVGTHTPIENVRIIEGEPARTLALEDQGKVEEKVWAEVPDDLPENFDVNDHKDYLASVEGNDPNAVNVDSKAVGRFQYLPSTAAGLAERLLDQGVSLGGVTREDLKDTEKVTHLLKTDNKFVGSLIIEEIRLTGNMFDWNQELMRTAHLTGWWGLRETIKVVYPELGDYSDIEIKELAQRRADGESFVGEIWIPTKEAIALGKVDPKLVDKEKNDWLQRRYTGAISGVVYISPVEYASGSS